MRPGQRVKLVRYLMGIISRDMADILGIDRKRFANIEHLSTKMNEEDFQQIEKVMPEILFFILSGKPMSIRQLKKSDTLLRTIPDRVKAGLVPDDFDSSMLTD